MMSPRRLAVEIDSRLDGPHADEHTSGAANLAAECVRFLNYATGSHSPAGLTFPSTAYCITADLSLTATRMPQMFTQLAEWLHSQFVAELLDTDDGTSVAAALAAAFRHLSRAALAAEELAAELNGAQNALAVVNGRGPNRRTGGAR